MVQEGSGSHGLLKSSESNGGLELIQEEDTQPSENTSEIHNEDTPIEVEPQNVEIPIRRSARIPQTLDRYGFYVDVEEYELGDLNEPPNYKAALSDLEFDKWLEAMNTKMQSMKDNQVWVFVDLPPNGRTVGSKWIFKKKTNMDGNVHTFKSRLVAKGYTQTYGVGYGETFSPVVDIKAIRILLTIVAFYDNKIQKMDVKTAFLNGHLSEDVYMVQPEGFVDPKHPNKVCKLQRSIYGLKQASRNLKASGSNVTFLILYVDDILLMGNNVTMLQEVKYWLCKCFSIKDLGEAAYTLGIKIIRDKSKRLIALKKPDYRKSQGAKTPSEVQRMQRVPYASSIGSIMYAVRCTRPDVAFANTKDMVLVYGEKPEAELKVSCYAGATEYIASTEASMEVVWMRKFIDGLGSVEPSNKRPMKMLCDNEPAIVIANDPGILKGAKHFQRKYHYIHEVIQEREIVLMKVHTDDNVVDLFKPVSYDKHYEHAMAIDIVPARSLM
ncbi:retrotransposon protein, putative, ty1-copia subclass [Tanacetum coccineum]